MEPLTALALLAAMLLLLLATGLWVAVALFLVAAVGMWLADAGAIGAIMATTTWGATSAWTLAALPLFVWMGEILFRSRLAEDLFRGLSPWLGRLPGGLLHANILGCGVFAAVSGSSAATCATIGRMTLPELDRRGYDRRLAMGTLAGSATLGLLIPPSLILIVYGVAAQVSIARLFVAGVLPGLLLIALFMAFTMLWSLRHPPAAAEPRIPWRQRLLALRGLLPVLVLIGSVIGAIYGGLATATEAAALGVVGALLLAGLGGTLNRRSFGESLMAATRTSCMIAFILAGAAFLTVAMGFTGIPRALVEGITSMGLSPAALLLLLTLLFLLLGCFLDGISLVVLTTAILLPVVVAAGIDPLWFGIYLVLVVEMSQITPPIGFNLFVIQGLTGRDILFIARAAWPFFLLMLLAIVVIAVFPWLVTWLPSRMGG